MSLFYGTCIIFTILINDSMLSYWSTSGLPINRAAAMWEATVNGASEALSSVCVLRCTTVCMRFLLASFARSRDVKGQEVRMEKWGEGGRL